MQQLVNTVLLCRIAKALNPAMTCDVQTLITDAACLTCIPPGMQSLVNTALLCNIASAISAATGAAGQVTCGNGAPSTAPTPGCGIYYDKVSTAFYYWDGAAWQLKV
jgi:hypothetical protein